MQNYKLIIAYDGSGYYGYQRQAGYITVQAVLEQALGKLLRQPIKINGSGRTDTGVHALGQVVNFNSDICMPLDNLRFALNNLLPVDVRVLAAEQVELEFHARYSAIGKHYQYKILCADAPTPFWQRYMWQLGHNLDLATMQAAADLIIGEHDFASFRSTGGKPGSAVRSVYRANWRVQELDSSFASLNLAENYRVYEFDIHGNGFLYHMVRNLVGIMVQVGVGKMNLDEFQQLFMGKKRTSKCVLAPAQGLYMRKVEYPNQ